MSLAQVLTLEGWSDVALVLQQVGGQSSPTVNTVRALSPFSALCSLWGVHCGMLQQVGGAPAGVYVSTAHTVPALPLHPVHSSHRGAALCVVQLCVLDRRAGLVLRAQLAPGSDVASDHRAAGEEGQSVRQDDAARARANQGARGSQGSSPTRPLHGTRRHRRPTHPKAAQRYHSPRSALEPQPFRRAKPGRDGASGGSSDADAPWIQWRVSSRPIGELTIVASSVAVTLAAEARVPGDAGEVGARVPVA
jgi:hypothetical protein